MIYNHIMVTLPLSPVNRHRLYILELVMEDTREIAIVIRMCKEVPECI